MSPSPATPCLPALILAGLAAWAPSRTVAEGRPEAQLRRELAGVGVTERLGAALPQELVFTDEAGRPFSLATPRTKPLLLSFNYTGCPRLCSLQLAGLARALKDLGYDGAGFELLAVSIDPAEKADALARYKDTYVRQAGGGAAVGAAWHFVSGRKADLDALAEAVGFRYRYDEKSGEFAHQATLVVVTPEGRVSSYLHGISYAAATLREAVARAGASRVATREEQAGLKGFLLTCMGFNPADPVPRAMLIMRVAGSLAVAVPLAVVLAYAVRDFRRRRPAP